MPSLEHRKLKKNYNSHEKLKFVCLSNKVTQLQTKGGISDGTLRVTYYDSRGIVSCNFIFHVADPR